MAATVLIAGCGDLGCALGRRLLADGLQVIGLRRRETPLPHEMRMLRADVTDPLSLAALTGIAPDFLVYCVAASAQSDDSYRAHYVDGLRNVLAALGNGAGLRHIFFVSSTRVYGQQTEALLDETSPAIPSDFGGERLLQAEALLESIQCPASALRLSGIYGPGRTRLLSLARRPQAWPAQNAWTNRIHRDDAADFIASLIRRVLSGVPAEKCYLVTDGAPAPQYEVLLWLAQQLGVSTAGLRIPPVGGGKRLDNAGMQSAGFKLRYQNYRAGYMELLRQERSTARERHDA